MKTYALILLLAFCFAECRKVVVPINKNANIDFINMESGGARPKPPPQAVPKSPVPGPGPIQPAGKPVQPPTPVSPIQPPPPKPVQTPPPKPVQPPPPKPVQPTPPNQIKPVPVNPKPVGNPITTPGPGSVQSLINFYDSQGKASPIRPYSYSQAVKQG